MGATHTQTSGHFCITCTWARGRVCSHGCMASPGGTDVTEGEGGPERGGITQTLAHAEAGQPGKGRGRRRGRSHESVAGHPTGSDSPGGSPAPSCGDRGDVRFAQGLPRNK